MFSVTSLGVCITVCIAELRCVNCHRLNCTHPPIHGYRPCRSWNNVTGCVYDREVEPSIADPHGSAVYSGPAQCAQPRRPARQRRRRTVESQRGTSHWDWSVFILGISFWGGFPSPKTYNSPPQTAARLCVLNLFYSRDNELQMYHSNFHLMDNNTGNYSPLSTQKFANLCLKCSKIRSAARLCSDPLGSLCAPPDP